jgi:tetratricopeptide (TPR) repeat protein
MKLIPRLLPTLLSAIAITVAQPRSIAALSAVEVNKVAKSITVLISGQNPGSGVMIKREGNIYTVLTARHVVATPDEYEIVTPNGQRTQLNYKTVRKLPDVDLATFQFKSDSACSVATLGDVRNASEGTVLYVAGFPVTTAAITQSIYTFSEGKLAANATRPLADGYALVYSNNTLPGMSGGPVLNEQGQLIGIHGRADTESTNRKQTANSNIVLKTGFNLGIPINTFLAKTSQIGFNPGIGVSTPRNPVPQQSQADNFYLQAVEKYEKRDIKGALANSDQAIRGLIRSQSERPGFSPFDLVNAPRNKRLDTIMFDIKGAFADFDQAIRLNPNRAETYYNRAQVREQVDDHQGAIDDFSQAIRLNPNFSDAYRQRAFSRQSRDPKGAIADFNQALRINPNDTNARNNRDFLLERQGNK